MDIREATEKSFEYRAEKSPYEHEIKEMIRAIVKCNLSPPNPEGWVISTKRTLLNYETDRFEKTYRKEVVYFLTKNGTFQKRTYTFCDELNITTKNYYDVDWYSRDYARATPIEEKNYHKNKTRILIDEHPSSMVEVMSELDFKVNIRRRTEDGGIEQTESYGALCTQYTEGSVRRMGAVKGGILCEELKKFAFDLSYAKTSKQQREFESIKKDIRKIETQEKIEKEKVQKSNEIKKIIKILDKVYVLCWIAFFGWLAFSIYDAYTTEFNFPFEIYKLSIFVIIVAIWNGVERMALHYSFVPIILPAFGYGFYSAYPSLAVAQSGAFFSAEEDTLVAFGKVYLIVLAVLFATIVISRIIGSIIYKKWKSLGAIP